MDDPRVSHMKAARRMLKYLKETLNCGILFPQSSNDNDVVITCDSNADWRRDKSGRKSITGYFF